MRHSEYDLMLDYLRVAAASKDSYEDIKARFEAENAATYGQSMSRWIPEFEHAQGLMGDCVSIRLPERAKGVDLGAGTGRVSGMLLERFPDLRLVLVDLSPNMLQEAERKLAGQGDRCEFRVHDMFLESLDFENGSLDFVVSSLAISHAQRIDVYERLYTRICRWLKPEGCFVCYDHVRGDSIELTALNAMGWHRLLRSTSTAEQAREGIVSTYQEDSPLSLREHLDLLSNVGFATADVLHKRDIFAVYAAFRSAGQADARPTSKSG